MVTKKAPQKPTPCPKKKKKKRETVRRKYTACKASFLAGSTNYVGNIFANMRIIKLSSNESAPWNRFQLGDMHRSNGKQNQAKYITF
jgi:hypothetical protein